MKLKGLRVNMDKTKVMCRKVRTGLAENSGRWPYMCSVQSGSWIIKLNKLYCLWKVGTYEVQWIDCLNVVGFECSRCVHGNTREAAEVKKEIEPTWW